MSDIKDKYCLVIPHFEQYKSLKEFLPKLMDLGLTCIIVDDGSREKTKVRLRERVRYLEKKVPGEIHLIEHEENKGKGAAIHNGSRVARSFGFTHMIQIDADGQHDLNDVPLFISESEQYPDQIISGVPVFDESVPKARLYGRKVTDFWVALETLSFSIRDSLCGFRVYPLWQFQDVYDEFNVGPRMDFDTDIMVKSVWQGTRVRFVDTKVVYNDISPSHFHYVKDNLRLIWLHTRLMCGMLIRLPKLLPQRLSGHKVSSN
ncbi:MAG: glycosyltransferase family 2 protein [Acidiferrobacterales bacterium]|nr:glycosyltransferase family 2 protein [Acidiferrobacterales bacterium]